MDNKKVPAFLAGTLHLYRLRYQCISIPAFTAKVKESKKSICVALCYHLFDLMCQMYASFFYCQEKNNFFVVWLKFLK